MIMLFPSFENMTRIEIDDFFKENSFIIWRKLDDGEYIALQRLMFTMSVCMGVELTLAYKYRWCFEDPAEAVQFFNQAKQYDDIPEQRESLKGHRYLSKKPLLVVLDELGLPKW